MLSTSADSGAPPLQQVQALPAVPQPSPIIPHGNGRLSLQDIAKHFHLPIADAASNLGVCTSALKRICREHGIARWPYRKYLAGKTFDDIKKEATREKAKDLSGLSNVAKQNFDAPNMISSTSIGLLSSSGNQVQNKAAGLVQEASRMQQGVSALGNSLQFQGNRNFQQGFSIQSQPRHIPTYFDDFKYGFPAKGLSSASVKWWGTNSTESAETTDSESYGTNEKEKHHSCTLTNESTSSMLINEQAVCNLRNSAITTDPSSSLVSLRKRAAECEHESLQVGVPNWEPYKLSKRRRLLLSHIFRSSLPDQWTDINA